MAKRNRKRRSNKFLIKKGKERENRKMSEDRPLDEKNSDVVDPEDLKETVEVNLKDLEKGSKESVEEKLSSLEKSLKELSSVVDGVKEDQEEIYRRLSMTLGDAQMALRDSDYSVKEVKRLRKEAEEIFKSTQEKLDGFQEEINKAISITEQVDNLSSFVENTEEKISLIDKISEELKNIKESLEGLLLKEDSLEGKVSDLSKLMPSEELVESLQRELHQIVDKFKDTFTSKIEKVEDGVERVKGYLISNLEDMEEKVKGLAEDFAKKFEEIKEQVPHEISDKISNLEAQILQVQEKVEEALGTIRGASLEKLALLDKRNEEFIEEFARIDLKIDSLREKVDEEVSKELSTLKQYVQDLEKKIEVVREDQRLEMEVFSEEIEGRLSVLDDVKEETEKFQSRIKALEEEQAAISIQIEDLSRRMENLVEDKLKGMDNALAQMKEKLEEEIEKRLSPLEAEVKDISGDLSEKLEPIRREVEEAKSYIQSELQKVKESWEKLDKAISDSEGAMEIARKAKESLERLDKEIEEAISKIDALMTSIKENTLKTDSNLEKINLTIKLIDEARERIKSIRVPEGIAPLSPEAAIPVEEMILTPQEILEDPDTSDIGFDLDDLLQVMIKHEASDLHLKAGAPPTVRLEGELIPVGNDVLSEEDCRKLILKAMTPSLRKKLALKKEVDFAYAIPEARFRVNAFLQKQSLSAAFRLLWTDIPTIEELNLPPVLKKLADYNNGLILITGPAGSGKSTTLAAMINYINETKKMHIITIEDPIEFIHTDKMSIITQREVGTDTESFSVALKQALRQDPNVILIGEMRDPETIMTAAIAAETGHLVLSTLHTPNTIQAINRIIDVFSGDVQKQFRLLLANTLRGVVSQRLLNRADGSGRIPAVEVMVVTPTISSLILEEKTDEIYPLMAQGEIDGMQTFTQSLKTLYEKGLVTREEAMFHADQPTEFRLAIEGHTTGAATLQDDNLMSWL